MLKRLKTNSVNLLALGSIGGFFIAAFFMRNNPNINQTWQILLLAGVAVSFFAGLFNYWKLLKISEAPISTIAAAAQGYIELQGIANCDKPLKTPYHGIPCVWYRAYAYANVADENERTVIYDSRLLDYSESHDKVFLKAYHNLQCLAAQYNLGLQRRWLKWALPIF